MKYSRNEILDILLKSYVAYYDITDYGTKREPLRALCEYYEHAEKYMVSKKVSLWSADSEEFIYLFSLPRLTTEAFAHCKEIAYRDGMERLHIGPGHMYSYITPIIVCDTCDEEAVKALKKCRIYKSFHFSLHGWMDFHAAAVIGDSDRIESNRAGRTTAKILKKVLFSKKSKRKGEFV